MKEARGAIGVAAAGLFGLLIFSATAAAQVPFPQPAPGGPPNIFYGATPPGDSASPSVLVFIHGLGGTANNWWLANNTYQMAFQFGYRTAFIGLSPDNTPNSDSLTDNAERLKVLIPIVAARYGVNKLVLIGHSKGGVDLQAAMLAPQVRSLVKTVFTLASPSHGTELADWAFGPGLPIAASLDLLSPGLFSLRTSSMAAFRAFADPVFKDAGIPFYTIEGSSALGNPITTITGAILKDLVPDEKNDGMVTVPRARLPEDYATDLDPVKEQHFKLNDGAIVMPKIHAVVQALELTLAELKKIEANGFGDEANSWLWSMKWFRGKLYVGTGREITCVTTLTSDVQQGTSVYAISVAGGGCPDVPGLARSLNAEIWRFDPRTSQWERVFKSPSNIPLMPDDQGDIILTARDIGFRGMTTFTEPDGTEALYVGSVTSGSIFGQFPQFAAGFPPPRILRTVDGTTWTALPHTPGTFMGDIGKPNPSSNKVVRSIRSLTSYKGMLFATAGTFTGVARVIASANPVAGNNAWFDASSSIDEFPVWDQRVFADRLYVTTGNKEETSNPGYGVYWTDATGDAPYQWHPVVTGGGYNANPITKAPNGLSMAVFNDQLYVGTNRPTELIRVNANGTWDLLVGEPRMTPHGFKTPLTGMGIGFGSWFNGHFWRMAAHEGHLYLGTWDWSLSARFLGEIGNPFMSHFGFDLYRTTDGIHWEALTRSGFGDKRNFGARSLESTPVGLFLGSTRPSGGLEVFWCRPPGCAAVPPDTNPPAPTLLAAESEQTSGRTVMLSWVHSPGALRYRVYRATVRSVIDILPGSEATVTIPGLPQPVTLDSIRAGQLDFLCASAATDDVCVIITAIKNVSSALGDPSVPDGFEQVAIVTDATYSEPAPTAYQSLYFVRAEDADGRLSKASNFVGAPSKRAAVPLDLSPPTIAVTVSPQANADGWHNGPVTITWMVADPQSNILSSTGCEPTTISTETPGTTLTCSATNGNSLTASNSVTLRIDMTAPTATFGAITPAANAAGWYNTDVTLPFEVTDNLSGAMSMTANSPLIFVAEGTHVANVSVADLAGNVATFSSPPIKIDKTAPEAYQFFDPDGFDLVTVGVDGLSGVAAGPVVASHAGGLGRPEIGLRTYQISDLAGNTLTIFVDVKRAGHSVKAEIRRLEYAAGPASRTSFNVPENQISFEYSAERVGLLRELTQKMSLGRGRDRQETEAKYRGKRNETQIRIKQAGEDRESKITEGGRRLLRMRTVNGQLVIDRGL